MNLIRIKIMNRKSSTLTS